MLDIETLDLRDEDDDRVHAIILCLGACVRGVTLREMLADGRPVDFQGIFSGEKLKLSEAIVFSNTDDLHLSNLQNPNTVIGESMLDHCEDHLKDLTHTHVLIMVISNLTISIGGSLSSNGDAPPARLRRYLDAKLS